MQNGKSLMLHCYNVTMLQYYKTTPYLMPIDKKDALTGYVAEVEVYLDGVLDQVVKLPASNNHRRLDLYFKYDLPVAAHKVSFKVKNPDKAHPVEVRSMIIYSDKPASLQHE